LLLAVCAATVLAAQVPVTVIELDGRRGSNESLPAPGSTVRHQRRQDAGVDGVKARVRTMLTRIG